MRVIEIHTHTHTHTNNEIPKTLDEILLNLETSIDTHTHTHTHTEATELLHQWLESDSLPVEVDIPSTLSSHTCVCCVVSRMVTSDDNPPMILTCGHILCKACLQRMSKNRLKCPICPQVMSLHQVKRAFF
eukprot:GHVR01053495.1.p1 GENE.GHVR01053495.1~~GHVR01053495.1.p1  ORF type:complete len:131 (-),score=74.01 GHVR01053495.1:179-571(-)